MSSRAGADALGRAAGIAAEAGPGDFIYVPPYVPHQEINASTDETLECVLVRSDNEAVVVNLDIEPVEQPEAVRWIDPIHKAAGWDWSGEDKTMRTIEGPSVWTRRDVRPEEYRIDLSAACLDEIRRAADEIRAFRCRPILREPGRFRDAGLPAGDGAGPRHARPRPALRDRRPPADGRDGHRRGDGDLLAAVEHGVAPGRAKARRHDDLRCLDTGQQALPGSGVRPDKTNIEIRFHNDNAYNETPPDYVGLLCLRQAQSGGHSRVISFHTVHNLC